ncbi:MAG: hypothetical protein R2827_06530 [Bdellovibrionales bacterium]
MDTWQDFSERVIGITIISIGTGLPELATSAVAAYRGRNDIAFTNVIGSNIMNTLIVVGATATISPISVSKQLLNFDSVFMLFATLALVPLSFKRNSTIGRWSGSLLLTAYVAYILALV